MSLCQKQLSVKQKNCAQYVHKLRVNILCTENRESLCLFVKNISLSKKSEEYSCDEVSHNGGGEHADESGHHERVVEQIFANDSGARAVEVDGGNIRWVVGNEEIAID